MNDVTEFDANTLLFTIMTKGGRFEPLYTDPNYFYTASTYWSLKWHRVFKDWFEDMAIEYNPIWNFDKNHEFTSTIDDTGTVDTTTTGREVTDSDSSHSITGTSRTVVDTDTTGTESTTGKEIVDEDSTSSKNTKTILDSDKTLTGSETVSNKEIVDDDTTLKKTGTDSKISSSDGLSAVRAPGTSHSGSIPAGTNSSTTETKVSAFDANDYQPSQQVTTGTSQSVDTYTDASGSETITHNTTDTGTDDKTTTFTGSKTTGGTEAVDSTETGTESDTGSVDRTTNTTGSKTTSGTEDSTVTGNTSENGTNSTDSTVNSTGTVDTDTTNKRRINEIGHDWGNYSSLTSQGMIKEDLKVRYFNIYEAIASIFLDELTVRVY